MFVFMTKKSFNRKLKEIEEAAERTAYQKAVGDIRGILSNSGKIVLDPVTMTAQGDSRIDNCTFLGESGSTSVTVNGGS